MQHGKLVKSKWVFKVKYDRDNNPYRFRARLVAKGFSQSSAHGDFDETYSPVMAYPSLRALLSLAAANDYMITGFDIKNAFVQQRIDVDHLYMESPDGVPKWKTTQEGRPAALHCLGSIYGLKQSSYLLHSRLSAFLQKHGYVPLVGDPCVYTRARDRYGLLSRSYFTLNTHFDLTTSLPCCIASERGTTSKQLYKIKLFTSSSMAACHSPACSDARASFTVIGSSMRTREAQAKAN